MIWATVSAQPRHSTRGDQWTKTHAEDGAVFNAAMSSGSTQRLPALDGVQHFRKFQRDGVWEAI
jgi:hypothetical protein